MAAAVAAQFCDSHQRRFTRSARGGNIPKSIAAAVAVRPHPVVRAQMPVLRFQLARAACRAARASSTCRRSIADLELALPLYLGAPRADASSSAAGRRACFGSSTGRDCSAPFARVLTLDAYAEITLEANPGTFEAQKFAGFPQGSGSIACRSVCKASICAISRAWDAFTMTFEARRAIEIAKTHFDNVNIDLMYAIARANAAGSRGRHRHCNGIRAPSCVGLSSDHRAQHLFPSPSAPLAGRCHRADMQES